VDETDAKWQIVTRLASHAMAPMMRDNLARKNTA